MIEILVAECRRSGATLLAVTHDPELMSALDVRYRLDHGRLERAG